MKICIISTTILPCPPKGYSGLEQIAYQQASGLAVKGHQVLLVAPTGSVAPPGVELHQTTLGESEKQAYSGYWQRLPEYDAIICNDWEKWAYVLKMEGKLKAPILGVMHAPAHTMYKTPPPVDKPCLVAISKDQSEAIKEVLKVDSRVAYNGVDSDFYTYFPEERKRWLFLARMSSIKGPQIAVDIANRLGIELDMVGDDKITGEPELATQIKKACAESNGRIVYHGGVDRDQTVKFFRGAKGLLHMNKTFREPFGLAPVEAQMCGTPVIAWNHGAMRETISEGVSGFLVESERQAENIIQNGMVEKLYPVKIREWAIQFRVENMINRYEFLIQEALDTGGW
jgi:glycosyltransferase involved in cell wall biosynthesis